MHRYTKTWKWPGCNNTVTSKRVTPSFYFRCSSTRLWVYKRLGHLELNFDYYGLPDEVRMKFITCNETR